jgi:hypothetical protein
MNHHICSHLGTLGRQENVIGVGNVLGIAIGNFKRERYAAMCRLLDLIDIHSCSIPEPVDLSTRILGDI